MIYGNNLCFVHCNCWQRCNSYEWYFLPRYILNYVLNCNSVRFVSYIYHKSNVIRPPTHSWHQLFGCELSFKILNEKVVTLSHCHFILYYMHVTILIRISIIQGSFMPNWLWTQESIERENEWFPHWIAYAILHISEPCMIIRTRRMASSSLSQNVGALFSLALSLNKHPRFIFYFGFNGLLPSSIEARVCYLLPLVTNTLLR